MKNRELNRQLGRLKWLIDQTAGASSAQLELQAHWGRYLCVLAAGFLENAIGEIYSDYARRTSSEPTANFVSQAVVRIQNPKAQRFVETAKNFKAEWGDDLERFLSLDGRKEALDSIMANRHLVAHGQDAGITVARLKTYLRKCVEVLEYIETQCGR